MSILNVANNHNSSYKGRKYFNYYNKIYTIKNTQQLTKKKIAARAFLEQRFQCDNDIILWQC